MSQVEIQRFAADLRSNEAAKSVESGVESVANKIASWF